MLCHSRAVPTALAMLCSLSTAAAQDPAAVVRTFQVPGASAAARLSATPDGVQYSLSRDGVTFTAPTPARYELLLRYAQFDPLLGEPAIPPSLRARADNRLFVVQYHTQALEEYRTPIAAMGGENLLFLANHANVWAMDVETAAVVRQLPWVRAVVPFHPAYKLDPALRAGFERAGLPAAKLELSLLLARRGGADHDGLARFVQNRGGTVLDSSEPTFLMSVELGSQWLAELAARDDVTWIEPMARPEHDMNIARDFHGSNYVETVAGMTGQGVRVEVLDAGTDTTHPDLANHAVHSPVNSPDPHGTCTAGIVGGTGAGNAQARGGAPSVFLSIADYASFSGGSRYAHSAELQNPALSWKCVLQTNSWGSSLTTQYTATSQNMDLILFDQSRLSILQSQSNQASQSSRPEAWAKNIISVGGIKHMNTLSRSDDNWTSGASIGPAADGRIKPDIASFYDSVLATDMVGAAGYSSTNYFTGFNGTSAATPITAGHLAIFYQMWHAGRFGNTPGATVFDSRPQNTTAKAIMINTATQWTFSGTAHDLTRTHQGWGGIDLRTMYDRAPAMLVVDEAVVLANLQSNAHAVNVASGTTELKVTMVYRDPPGTVSSTQHRINNLNLQVSSPSGTIYHGNNGLLAGMFSTAGGAPNNVDTVENVFVANPEAGNWTVTITAAELNQDAHVETPALDADYALVVSGGSPAVPTPPAAPTGLVATGGSGQISLSWTDNANNEDNFVVERGTDGTSFAPRATLPANTTTWADTGLGSGETWFYRVQATNGAGASGYSNTASATTITPPAAPTGLTALGGSGQISLSWTDNANNETSFAVERSADGASFSPRATLPANTTAWVDTGLGSGETWFYRVQATNGAGASGYSNTASATTSTTVDLVPTTQTVGHGTVAGTVADVQTSNGVYQSVTEVVVNRRNSLEHEWQIAGVPTTGSRTFRLEAFRTASTDGDTFAFQCWNGSAWIAMVTVTKTADDGVYQTFALPDGVGGTLRVRVVDANNKPNAAGNDTIFVDHMLVRVN